MSLLAPEEHRRIAFAVTRNAVQELRDTPAMEVSEIADDIDLDEADDEAIMQAVGDLADQFDALLDEEEGG